MNAEDFRFDGQQLSDYGFMICSFDNNTGLDTVTMGSHIKFHTVATEQGKKHILASTEYDECLETEFDICLNPCDNADMVISLDRQRELMRWLNRRTFHKFEILDEESEYSDIHFMGSFNVDKIIFNDDVIGLHLMLKTDKPFGYQSERKITFDVTDTDKLYSLSDVSDEIGYIYPKVKVITTSAGDSTDDYSLRIIQHFFNGTRTSQIKNVSSLETIIMNYPMIETDNALHSNLMRDFNWNFPRIDNSYDETINKYEFNRPCKVEFVYSPIAKVSL